MTDDEISIFLTELDAVSESLDRPCKSATAKALYIRQLAKYGLKNLLGAINAHLDDPERGRFAPSIADLQHQIAKAIERDQRPTADEAWAIAVQLQDEHVTVVTNEEISQAWAVASEVMPDRIGARMTFKAAYERLVAEGRGVGRQVKWFPSLGLDTQGRAEPLLQAVEKGLLTHDFVQPLIQIQHSAPDLKQLEYSAPTPQAKQAIQNLHGMLKNKT